MSPSLPKPQDRDPLDGWRTLRRFIPYLWPADRPALKRRIVGAMVFVLFAKATALALPYVYKRAIDAMTTPANEAAMVAMALVIAYAAGRLAGVVFDNLRNITFERVGQEATRALAQDTGDLVEARAAAMALLQGVAGRPPIGARLGLAQKLVEIPRKRGAGTDREVLARRLDALSLLVRDLGVVGAPDAGTSGGDAVLANPDLGRDLAAMARHFDTARVLSSFAAVDQARRSLDRNQAAKVVADWLACEM